MDRLGPARHRWIRLVAVVLIDRHPMLHATTMANILGEPTGQGWKQVIELALAFVLSSIIGLEREIRQKSAGLRTHALVGLGAALFVLISKYGFTDVLSPGTVVLDPSRIAAQIVSGIGFIGAGLIFVRRDSVRGLTTAAVIWITAAVGTACGAGLPVLGAVVTGAHFIAVLGYPPLVRRLPRSRFALSTVQVRYDDGRGLLRTILAQVTRNGFTVAELTTSPGAGALPASHESGEPLEVHPVAEVTLLLQGKGAIHELATQLSEIQGVVAVSGVDTNNVSE
jgi:putative Mg2+ transporter-C (MgtC) family protein